VFVNVAAQRRLCWGFVVFKKEFFANKTVKTKRKQGAKKKAREKELASSAVVVSSSTVPPCSSSSSSSTSPFVSLYGAIADLTW
jgi:hypothetical protein